MLSMHTMTIIYIIYFYVITFKSEPFVRRSTDGNYSGSAVNLIDFIANEVGFDYELYESPDSRYGVPIEGNKWNGMIGQVLSQVCML